MTKWFEDAFGAAATEVVNAIEDARDKLIFEAWFGRDTVDQKARDDLGWTLNEPRESANFRQPDLDHNIDR